MPAYATPNPAMTQEEAADLKALRAFDSPGPIAVQDLDPIRMRELHRGVRRKGQYVFIDDP